MSLARRAAKDRDAARSVSEDNLSTRQKNPNTHIQLRGIIMAKTGWSGRPTLEANRSRAYSKTNCSVDEVQFASGHLGLQTGGPGKGSVGCRPGRGSAARL